METKFLPAPKSLEKILHISYQQSEKQEAYPYDGHGEKNFPQKIARNLIPSQGANLLSLPQRWICVSKKVNLFSKRKYDVFN